ncbi:MAG: GGDEF domain-containing protein [Gammaproteobacteria bacterium]
MSVVQHAKADASVRALARSWTGLVAQASGLLAGLSAIGTKSNRPFESRQIVLINQFALLGAAATFLYQVFYAFYDFRLLLPVLVVDVLFVAAFLSVLYMNHVGRNKLAVYVCLGTAYLNIGVVTAMLGTGTGIHLYYFTLSGVVYFMLPRTRVYKAAVLLLLAIGLYLICHFNFGGDDAFVKLPADVLEAVYACSAVGAMALAGIGSYLIRLDIHNSEKRLAHVNRELQALSGLDGLTGLPNRRGLDEYLHREWGRMARYRQPFSALMCDVDGFKNYNDDRGHLAGDSCLQAVAAALQGVLSRPQDFVGRYGGDEFMVLLPETDRDGALHLAEEARRAVAAMAIGHGGRKAVSCTTLSVGVATVFPERKSAPDESIILIAYADRALYRAKALGRNRSFVYAPVDFG